LETTASVGTKSSYHHPQSELLEKPSSSLEIAPTESVVGSASMTSDVRKFQDADVEEFQQLPKDSKCQPRQQLCRPRHRVSYDGIWFIMLLSAR